jgi:hypothetical protein
MRGARGLILSILVLLSSGSAIAQHLDAIKLENSISDRLGIRYRLTGTDDSGYDCSGFVWRVLQEAGMNFERSPASALWQLFPEASLDQRREFGTIVFFNGLRHVGIVRDAYSFYHASRTQGIVLSYFSGYWEKRITGFRSARDSVMPRCVDPLTCLAQIPGTRPSFPYYPRQQ